MVFTLMGGCCCYARVEAGTIAAMAAATSMNHRYKRAT